MLCVVDMQPDFLASNSSILIDAVISEIKLSMAAEEQIIILEYWNHHTTHIQIMELLQGYKHAMHITKYLDDGSKWMENTIAYFPKEIKICGVNTWACVYATGIGLASKFPSSKIIFIERACNDGINNCCLLTSNAIKSYDNIKIVCTTKCSNSRLLTKMICGIWMGFGYATGVYLTYKLLE